MVVDRLQLNKQGMQNCSHFFNPPVVWYLCGSEMNWVFPLQKVSEIQPAAVVVQLCSLEVLHECSLAYGQHL